MRLKSLRIQRFRSFDDETVVLNRYSCFVGPNGAGKSSILAALNVFFRDQSGAPTDIAKLTDEDYFNKATDSPIRITATFDDLGPAAQLALSAYTRQGELVVRAEAVFDAAAGFGAVRHYGQRAGMEQFRHFFEAEKAGSKVVELKALYEALTTVFTDLPSAKTKDAMVESLRDYEGTHPELGVLIPSEDQFYGVNSTGKLNPFVQWVYVPAVKDAMDEGLESKTTALGKLIGRAVRARTTFDADLEDLKAQTLAQYQELLNRNQGSLIALSESLQLRLGSWAHPNVKLGITWLSDPNKSVSLQQPVAGIQTGEGDFLGSLSRMGHGLQRSYLLALLQELAGSEAPDAPTLILGIEEPELYQHPPQARHLADVLTTLASGNNQILITTHSPLFITGGSFDDTRLVRRTSPPAGSTVAAVTFDRLCTRIRSAYGDDETLPPTGMIAKIQQDLHPGITEMFFARVPVLVEGFEDAAYITTELHLSGKWTDFRRFGCHLIPVNAKHRLVHPLAIAVELDMPIFVVFDADGSSTPDKGRGKHERDNRALISLLGATDPPFPQSDVWGTNHTIWEHDLTRVVKSEFGDEYGRLTTATRIKYADEGGLEKNAAFIADWLAAGRADNHSSPSLCRLCDSILTYAQSV